MSGNSAPAAAELGRDGRTLTVHVPLTFRKRGGRKIIISPAGVQQPAMPVRHVDSALVRALAQAFQWKRLLDEHEYASVSELAAARKLDRTVVSRTLRLTLLAPQLVEAILDGRHSEAVQLQKLLHSLPTNWAEQETKLGLPRC